MPHSGPTASSKGSSSSSLPKPLRSASHESWREGKVNLASRELAGTPQFSPVPRFTGVLWFDVLHLQLFSGSTIASLKILVVEAREGRHFPSEGEGWLGVACCFL